MIDLAAKAFDALLAGLILWLAWSSLSTQDILKGIVLFIAFGLCMGLAWVRLNAPDIALVEAAVASGITGAMLLGAWNKMRLSLAKMRGDETKLPEPGRPWLHISGLMAMGGALGWAIFSIPPENTGGLLVPAMRELPRSGVGNPVTAALLNYRAYDTLLEIGVLLLAVVGVWSIAKSRKPAQGVPRGPILYGFARISAPLLILIGGYFLWLGTSRAGGAFQAGALMAAVGVLLVLTYGPTRRVPAEWIDRWGSIFGLTVFLTLGIGFMLQGRAMLEYSAGSAGAWILVIESAATVSIGWTLLLLFLGGRPQAASQKGILVEEDEVEGQA